MTTFWLANPLPIADALWDIDDLEVNLNGRSNFNLEPLLKRFRLSDSYDFAYPLFMWRDIIVDGNRRLAAAKHLKDTDQETFNRIFPNGRIPVRIFKS